MEDYELNRRGSFGVFGSDNNRSGGRNSRAVRRSGGSSRSGGGGRSGSGSRGGGGGGWRPFKYISKKYKERNLNSKQLAKMMVASSIANRIKVVDISENFMKAKMIMVE